MTIVVIDIVVVVADGECRIAVDSREDALEVDD